MAPTVQSTGSQVTASITGEELKELLQECYSNLCVSSELSDWLRELGEKPNGTLGDKLWRLRRRASSLVMPAEPPARQAIFYLFQYEASILSDIWGKEKGVGSLS